MKRSLLLLCLAACAQAQNPPAFTCPGVKGAFLLVYLTTGQVTCVPLAAVSGGGIGPIGPAGPQGSQGPQGVAGSQGIQGLPGEQGQKGDTGPSGAQGAIGPVGPAGSAGPEGPRGLAGPQGPAGASGAGGGGSGGNFVVGEVLKIFIEPIGPDPMHALSYVSRGTLAHAPIGGSVAVYAGNLRVPPDQFTVDGDQLSVLAWAPTLVVDYRW